MSKYYIPMAQPLSELNRDELKQYLLYAAAFEHGKKLMFEEFQPALKLATTEIENQTKGQFFQDWRPIIPAAALITMCSDGVVPNDVHVLTGTEKTGMNIPQPADVFFGEPNPGHITSVSVFFENDVLHDQYGLSAPVVDGKLNLSVIANIAGSRVTAMDLLTDAIYRMPTEERIPFANEITAQLCRFSKTNESDALRMVLGTEPLDIKAGLPTTELFASMVGTSAKSLKGFAQDSSLGLDFGMRLLQRADKQLSWELRADTIAQMHDMHYMYGQALSQTSNRDNLSCTNALASALLQWSWKLNHDIDIIVENIDTLGALAGEIQREMERPADQAFTELIQAVPAAQQCEFRTHLLQCPHVSIDALLCSTDMREIQAGVTLACKYAAEETDLEPEECEALDKVLSDRFITKTMDALKEDHGDNIPGILNDKRFDDMLNAIYDVAETPGGIDDELSDIFNEEVIED